MSRALKIQQEMLSGSPSPNFTAYSPAPIIAKRNPTSTDVGYQLGQSWINKLTGTAFQLTQVAAGSAVWQESAGSGGYPITPYVVGPVGQAGYQTIQSAVNAAQNAGGGTVFVMPGTYTENVSITEPDVNLLSFPGENGNIQLSADSGIIPAVTVNGTLTVDVSANAGPNCQTVIEGFFFNPPSGNVVTNLTFQGNNNYLSFNNCMFSANSLHSYVFIGDGFPQINLTSCTITEGTAGNGRLLDAPLTDRFLILACDQCTFGLINSSTPCPISSGSDIHIFLNDCSFPCLIDLSSATSAPFTFQAKGCYLSTNLLASTSLINFGANAGSLIVTDCIFNGGGGSLSSSTNVSADAFFQVVNTLFTDTYVATNNCRESLDNCTFAPNGGTAFTMSSTGAVFLSNCTINTSANPAISGAGAGTLTLNNVSFLDNASIAGTVTLSGSKAVMSGELRSGADAGGFAGFTSLTKTNSTTIGAGVGSVRMSNGNAGTNAAWIKFYIGTTAYWVPAWTTNTP